MYKKLIGLLEKPQKRQLSRFALLSLLSPIAELFSVSMIIPIFQKAFQQELAEGLLLQIVFLSLVLLLVGVFELLKSWASISLVTDISQFWSVQIYDLYSIEELADHNQKTPMQAINGVRTDTATCASVLTTFLGLATDLLTMMVYFVVLIYVAQWVGAVSCVAILCMMLLLYRYNRSKMSQFGEKRRQLEIRAGGLVSTGFGSYKELKIDSRKANMREKYRSASADGMQVQKDYALMTGIQGIVLQNGLQAGLFLLLAAVLAAGIPLSGILPEAMVYLALLIRMLPGAKRIISSLTSLRYATKYYEAFTKDMERYKQLKEKEAQKAHMRQKQAVLNQGIRVRNLSFHYPNGKQIFEDVSVDIPAGRSIAIIGPSGGGKTTFLDLILGLLHPQKGHIWYDDYDIVGEEDSEGACWVDLGSIVSYIPQVVYLDSETVRNNVVFMADQQEEDKLIQCLQCAQMWEDVQEMPQGLDTVIGQNGITVSGGQRQRIALARALYKDFEILMMDEATAALDVDTERAVIDSIRQMKGSKTLLMVTHHMSLANECECIYKLENKRLVRVK